MYLRRMDMHVCDGRIHQKRRVHLEHLAIREELAHLGKQLRASSESLARSSRTPLIESAHAPGVLSFARGWPMRIIEPGPIVVSHSSVSRGYTRITVDPMLKRPISAPLASF